MALVADQKFSTFQNGGDLEVNDIIVGLRDGLNTRFTYTGNLPVGFIVPVAQGGTGANNAADARTNLGLGTMAVQNANAVAITGGTAALASGSVTAAPTSATDIANKAYVDERTDLHFMEAVQAASTANFTSTYDNGTAGVGATLTATSNGAFTLDGQAGVLDARYLIKNQTDTFENGIYDLTQVGDGSNPAILTRSADFNQASEIDPGDIVPVLSGTVNGSTAWIQTATVNTIGTDPIVFSQWTVNFNNVVTINGTQTITGAKTMNDLTLGADMDADSNKIINLTDPTDPQDAATKAYVDGIINSTLTVQIFDASGTWTKPSGLKNVIVEGVGGGSGGSGTNGVVGQVGVGGSGASGGYVRKLIDAASLGASETVTIGAGGAGGASGSNPGIAGGTTSFGAHCSATGGSAPNAGVASLNFPGIASSNGNSGTGVGGDINLIGINATRGILTANSANSAPGGSSLFGGNAIPRAQSGGGASNGAAAGANTGSGGSGGVTLNTATGAAGGAGADGKIIVWEFY